MMEARSTLLGQRVEQVSHEAQYQIDLPPRTRSNCPSCRSRTIRFGGCSMKERIGQPAEHFPHWKHRRTDDPDRASTFFTKPAFIVSRDSGIFRFLLLRAFWSDIQSPAHSKLPKRPN